MLESTELRGRQKQVMVAEEDQTRSWIAETLPKEFRRFFAAIKLHVEESHLEIVGRSAVTPSGTIQSHLTLAFTSFERRLPQACRGEAESYSEASFAAELLSSRHRVWKRLFGEHTTATSMTVSLLFLCFFVLL